MFELMDMNIYELIRGRRHDAEDRVKASYRGPAHQVDGPHAGEGGSSTATSNLRTFSSWTTASSWRTLARVRASTANNRTPSDISTRWWRAVGVPAHRRVLQLQDGHVGVGCVFFEIVSLFPLFPGTRTSWIRSRRSTTSSARRPPSYGQDEAEVRAHGFQLSAKSGTGIEKLIPHAPPSGRSHQQTPRLQPRRPSERFEGVEAPGRPRDSRDGEEAVRVDEPQARRHAQRQRRRRQPRGPGGSAATSSDARSDRTATLARVRVRGERVGAQHRGEGDRRRRRRRGLRTFRRAQAVAGCRGRTGRTRRLRACTAATTRAPARTTAGPTRARSSARGVSRWEGLARRGAAGTAAGGGPRRAGRGGKAREAGGREPVKLGGGYGGVAGSSYGGFVQEQARGEGQRARADGAAVGGWRAEGAVGHRTDKYVSPYIQQRR